MTPSIALFALAGVDLRHCWIADPRNMPVRFVPFFVSSFKKYNSSKLFQLHTALERSSPFVDDVLGMLAVLDAQAKQAKEAEGNAKGGTGGNASKCRFTVAWKRVQNSQIVAKA